MITLEQVKENILNLGNKGVHMDDFHNEITAAFEDFEYNGEDCVIVTSGSSNWEEYPDTYQAYVNHADSPILLIEVEYTDSCIFVDDVTITNI